MPSTVNIDVSVDGKAISIATHGKKRDMQLTFRQLVELLRQLGEVGMRQAVLGSNSVVGIEL